MGRLRVMVVSVVLAVVGDAAGQTSIVLRTGVRVAEGRVPTIGDVASVGGEDAERIRALAVREAAAGGGGMGAISLDEIRGVLERAGVNWGRTTLCGSKCELLVGDGQVDPVGAEAAQPTAAGGEPKVVDLAGPATIRAYVAVSLARLLGVSNDDLRLAFDEKDKSLLDTPVAGRRMDVQPTATGSSGAIPVRIYLFEGDRLAGQQTITVRAVVRRSVVTAAMGIDRRQVIVPEMLTAGEQWLSPGAGLPCTMEQAVGAAARGRINAGRVITPELLVTPIAVRRGDLVPVHCLSGNVRVEVKARALADARDGEMVELRIDGAKNSFSARMSGGRAVMLVEGARESQATEAGR